MPSKKKSPRRKSASPRRVKSPSSRSKMHAEKRDRPSCSPRKKSIAHTKKGKKYPSRPLSAWVLLVREVHCQHKATSKDGRMTFKASLMNAASLKDKFYKEVGRKASECSAAAVTKFVAENL